MKKIFFLIVITITLGSCGSDDYFSGNWECDPGLNFGMPSTLIITKDNDSYKTNLDNKKFTGTIDKSGKKMNFKGYILTYSKDKDELLLSPHMLYFTRN